MTPRPRTAGALPWLLLLPALALALPEPISLLAFDPFPHLAGTTLVSLTALPTALWLAVHGGPRLRGAARGLGLLALLVALTLGSSHLREVSDPFEARMRVAWIANALVLALGGAALDPLGRRTFNRGAVVISCLLTITTLMLWRVRGPSGLAGPLGNTGLLSQAALPGAAIGAWYIATRRGAFRALGWVAFVAFLIHAERAPAVAGSLALLGVLVLSALRSPWSRGRARVRRQLGGLGAVVAFTSVLLTTAGEGESSAPESHTPGGSQTASRSETPGEGTTPDPSVPDATLGGLPARLLIWSRLGAVLLDHPGLGLGPGQFQASFPPYRDPTEMELSRGGRCGRGETVVDHPHSDWLIGFFELGLTGGLLVAALFLLAVGACLRALASVDFATIAMGTGALGLLLNGLVHGPLFVNPGAGAIGWVLIGGVLAGTSPGTRSPFDPPDSGSPRPGGRLLGMAVLLPAGLSLFLSWPAWGHGRALADHARATIAGDRVAAELAAQRALEQVPASADAVLLQARVAQAVGDTVRAADHWRDALELRPHHVETLTNLGLARLRLGDLEHARHAWERAVELAPTHPRTLENLTRLLVLEASAGESLPWIARTRTNGCTDPAWYLGLGLEASSRGRWRAAAALLFAQELEELSPEAVYPAAEEERFEPFENPKLRVRALAHVLWAREQQAAGEHATAVRSFRQALIATRDLERAPRGSRAANLELGALLALSGRVEQAAEQIEGFLGEAALPWPEDLPDWVRPALESAGLASAP